MNYWKHTSVAIEIMCLNLLYSKGRKSCPVSEVSFLISQSLCPHFCYKIIRSVTERGTFLFVFLSIHIWIECWERCFSWCSHCISILLPLGDSLVAQRFPHMFPSQIYYFISGVFPSSFSSNLFAFNQFHASVTVVKINCLNIILKLRVGIACTWVSTRGFVPLRKGSGKSVRHLLPVSPSKTHVHACWHLQELQVGKQMLAFLTLSSSKLWGWTLRPDCQPQAESAWLRRVNTGQHSEF